MSIKSKFFIIMWSYILFTCDTFRSLNKTSKYIYPLLYRDYVFHNLSTNGMEMFYAINIHPLCVEKKGQCIPRRKCVGKKMLYMSRICYKRDLVCCYDDTIQFPAVEPQSHSTSSKITNATSEDTPPSS